MINGGALEEELMWGKSMIRRSGAAAIVNQEARGLMVVLRSSIAIVRVVHGRRIGIG